MLVQELFVDIVGAYSYHCQSAGFPTTAVQENTSESSACLHSNPFGGLKNLVALKWLTLLLGPYDHVVREIKDPIISR